MALHEDEIALVLLRRTAPEMIEADLIQGRRGSVTRNVPAILGANAVCVDDHRHRVPADVGLDSALERAVAGILGLSTGKVDHPVEKEMSALWAVLREDRIDGLDPFAGLYWVNVVEGVETTHIFAAGRGPGNPLIRA
jgi:hypothetical protein